MASNFLIFEFYNVRSSCLQLSVARLDPNPKYNKDKTDTVVFLTMAPSIDKQISMDVVKRGGTQLFDYNNKTIMKLEKHEVAAIAKLKNPFYIKQYTQPAFDQSGRPKQDKNGNPMTKTDNFIHADQSKGSTTALTIGINQQDETGIFVSTFYKQGQAFKNNIVYLNTNQTYELACAAEWALTRIYEDCETKYQKQNITNNTQNQDSSFDDDLFGSMAPAPNSNPQPTVTNTPTTILNIDDMLN